MKQFYLFIGLIIYLFPLGTYAQSEMASLSSSEEDELIVDIGYENWMDAPANISTDENFNRGFTVSLFADLGKKNSWISFAPGFGFSTSNIFTDAAIWKFNEDGEVIDLLTQDDNYRKSKVSFNYLEIPLELRLRFGKEDKKKFKIFIGGKAGLLFDAHTKIKYADGDISKFKDKSPFNIFRYGAYARIGCSFISVYGFYGLSDVFDTKNAPETKMYSIGISLTSM